MNKSHAIIYYGIAHMNSLQVKCRIFVFPLNEYADDMHGN